MKVTLNVVTPPPPPPVTKQFDVELVEDCGEVKLRAIVQQRGWLLAFQSDGTIRLCGGVSPDLGLKLDALGRIVIRNSY
ncbi:hypothetical protein UFOVP823_45 [uncultured Caudovirales phage]|uniref:Uncharacterized protein n=1 Tax=uncultured Caudovirales phage TaxID=2100421 RepID=A0A6J5P7N3_9CAUD|nr:hypothetical protein UFOVP823_45 [uncultured Caudovirales phage]